MLSSKELRKKYLDFFSIREHAIIPSASLIPENDPSILFTTAGMHPLVPYLLGEKHSSGKRLVNVQKCVRTQDIDEVGDNKHITFFEMLGNWSLGSYFKEEAIKMSWEFLTDKKWLGLDEKKLAITVFAGDNDAPRDEETAGIWKTVGIPEHKIAYLPKENNWWIAAATGPCGPDTEIFYWNPSASSGQVENEYPPESSNPGNDENNWLEIWNDVFMQYNKTSDGQYTELKQKNVDTGMGLERTLVVLNNLKDVFEVDTFQPIIKKIEEIACLPARQGDKRYKTGDSSPEFTQSNDGAQNDIRSMRIIADHLRTATMIMGDDLGIAPSNVDQGYVVRKLIRRAVRHGKKLGIENNFCVEVAEQVINIFQDVYPEVEKNRDFVLKEMEKEENKFRNTLGEGIKLFEVESGKWKVESVVPGREAFDLYQTYGFPLEMTTELAQEKGLKVDVEGFNEEMKKHQELSRAGAEQKFKGGLADASEMSTKYHTATHLLLAALRQVLGADITQKGSNITVERLRFDFNWPEKMTQEQIKAVENLVNEKIKEKIPVEMLEMPKAEALKKITVLSFDPSKYGDIVRMYKINGFSAEFCGGPHVKNTGELGHFKIIKEEASSAGIRRIKAILE